MAQSQRDAVTFQFIANTNATLRDLKTGLVYNWKTPSNIAINPNRQTRKTTRRNNLGENITDDILIQSSDPVATLTYSGFNFEMLAFAMGKQLESGTYDVTQPFQVQAKTATYAAATTGQVGFGIVADAETYGSKTDITGAKKSVPLTQQPFASFVATTANTFAVGANRALKFSDNLVEDGAFVTLSISRSIAGNYMGNPLNAHEFSGLVVGTDKRVMIIYIPEVIIDPSQGQFDPSSEQLQIPMQIIQPLDWCDPFKLIDTAQTVYCAA